MRGVHVLAGIASAGLVAVSLVMGTPASAATVNGTGGDDHLRGTPFSDTIRGFGGNDRVHALAGADVIFGGRGSDGIVAGRGADTIRGGNADDFLDGGQGADTIRGRGGQDGIAGGAGSDVIFGGSTGDFLLRDGQGTDTIHGGLGDDYFDLAKDQTRDTVTCGPGHDQVWGATPGENTIAADCEEVHVKPFTCGGCRVAQRPRPPAAGAPTSSRARPLHSLSRSAIR